MAPVRNWRGLITGARVIGPALPTLATVAIVALFLNEALIPSLLQPPPAPAVFTVEAPRDKNPDALLRDLWLWRVIADGRLLRLDQLQLNGEWRVEGDAQYPFIVYSSYPTDPGPASVSFRARRAAVIPLPSAWSGIVTLRRSDGAPERADLYVPRDRSRPAPVLTASPRRTPAWGTGAFALVIGALWLFWQPWRTPRREWVWLAGYVGLLHAVVWAVYWVGTNEDSPAYRTMWEVNLAGGPQFFPPGYGAFLALADLIPLVGKGTGATLLQHLMMVASLLWLYGLVLRFAPRWLASAWLVGTALLTPTLYLPQMIQSENVALFAMAGSVYFAVRAADRGSVALAVLSGAFLGVAVLARTVPIVIAPALVALQFMWSMRAPAMRRATAIVASAAVLVVAPMMWFAAHGNGMALTIGAGRHLFNRVVVEQRLVDASGVATSRVQRLLPTTDLTGTYPWDLVEMLSARGLPPHEVDQLIGEVAFEGLRTAPERFFLFSFDVAWRDYVANPTDLLNWFARSPVPDPDLENPPVLEPTDSGLQLRADADWLFAVVWRPLCLAALAGLLLVPFSGDRRIPLLLAAVPLTYLLACGFVQYHLSRYNVAVTPFVTAVAVVPLAVLVTRRDRRAADASSRSLTT